jgi:hypothetical protein
VRGHATLSPLPQSSCLSGQGFPCPACGCRLITPFDMACGCCTTQRDTVYFDRAGREWSEPGGAGGGGQGAATRGSQPKGAFDDDRNSRAVPTRLTRPYVLCPSCTRLRCRLSHARAHGRRRLLNPREVSAKERPCVLRRRALHHAHAQLVVRLGCRDSRRKCGYISDAYVRSYEHPSHDIVNLDASSGR